MVYQFNSDMLPDTYFHPGDLKYIVPGNEGRWLDPRRTPIRGARWEVQLESVDRCQFAQGSAEASQDDSALYKETISRLDRQLEIAAEPTPSCGLRSHHRVAACRDSGLDGE